MSVPFAAQNWYLELYCCEEPVSTACSLVLVTAKYCAQHDTGLGQVLQKAFGENSSLKKNKNKNKDRYRAVNFALVECRLVSSH